jgi:hypothetical protein
VRPPFKPLISLLKSGVLILFFFEKQARFANGLQNLFDLRSWLGWKWKAFAGAKGLEHWGADTLMLPIKLLWLVGPKSAKKQTPSLG